ncbi:GNAT family N-acetyltransferase [Fictibacillus sp. BK138]|uniref:GNAT family N-acetyltransferase n=1 Tax=Fictibacillus sp. BK138 TaxID=2512121 RepID=UPI00102A85C6|nr:GNAT family N-acetyltransferase [Fictibacillus sp. BK138]RZT21771.1 L-amino acid N-acyltransferase YncA [Fictibacillus sp. BK138]
MKIRHAEVKDAAQIAKVQVQSWQASYKGIVDSNYLSKMSIDERTLRWEEWLLQGPSHIVFVLEDDHNDIWGFISGGRIRSDHPYESEIYAFYLLKEIQQKGYGTKMIKRFSQQLVKQGQKSMIVWVLKDNPAKKAYISLGGIKIDEELIAIGSQSLMEECYAWQDLQLILD